MMGKAVNSLDVPVGKGQNSITVLTDSDAHRKPADPCIRCAKCVSACPMGLEPFLLATCSAKHMWDKVERSIVSSHSSPSTATMTAGLMRDVDEQNRKGRKKKSA